MPSRRDPWLDNAKMVLVTVVVVGHAVVLLPAGELKSQVYDFIYYFHIPAFVLLSGYLSRSFRWSRRHLTGLVTTLLIPYVLFSWLMMSFRVHVTHEVTAADLDPWLTNPRWPMWYLIVLLVWRLATPVLKSHPVMVPLAVAVSLVAGRVDLELFDLNRAAGLLPFFVLGLHLPALVVQGVQRRWTPVVGLAVLVAIWWLAGRTDDFWGTQWLYFRAPYEELGAGFGEGAWIRARLLLVGLAGTLAVLTLVPRRHTFLSAMGAWTMVVYLLHGFPLRYLEDVVGYTDLMPGDGYLSLVITVAGAVALALLHAWPPLAGRLVWVVDPVSTTLARRERRRTPSGAQA